MNDIIKKILENGFSLEMGLNKTHNRIEYELGGFYKSDKVTLYENDHGTLTAIARYNEITIIDNFYNLVSLNYTWWITSRDRFEGWKVPDSMWLPFLIEEGFVKEEISVVKTYK